MLEASSITQRPNEKLEAPRPHRTDVGLQALLPEINTGANGKKRKKEKKILCWGRY